jgi:hypothetical protein
MSDDNDTEQQSDEKPADDSEQSAEESGGGEQPAEQSDNQPAEETDQSAEQSEEQTTDSDQPAEQSEEQPAETGQTTEQSEEQPTDGDQSTKQSDEKRADDQPAEQSNDKPADDSLSPARAKVVNEILPEVIPAKYKHGSNEDQARFERLLPGVDIEAKRKAFPGYTTCGALPAYVLNKLGGVTDKGVLCGGLGGVRDGIADKQGKLHGGAKALGAWVDNDGSTPPKPGDIYILEGPIHYTDKVIGKDQTINGIRHIGIIVSVSTTTNDDNTVDWKTADAGQGTGVNQEADYQIRKYDSQAKTVTGKADKGTVVGWVDLDLLLAKSAGN